MLLYSSTQHPTEVQHIVAHALAVRAHTERVCDDVLHFRGVLGRAVEQHRPVFLWECDRDLTLEIEVILAAGDHGSLEAMWSGGEHRGGCAAHEGAAGDDITARRQCSANIEQRRKLVVSDARETRRLACRRVGLGGYGE